LRPEFQHPVKSRRRARRRGAGDDVVAVNVLLCSGRLRGVPQRYQSVIAMTRTTSSPKKPLVRPEVTVATTFTQVQCLMLESVKCWKEPQKAEANQRSRDKHLNA
jgi:hypothetical protein